MKRAHSASTIPMEASVIDTAMVGSNSLSYGLIVCSVLRTSDRSEEHAANPQRRGGAPSGRSAGTTHAYATREEDAACSRRARPAAARGARPCREEDEAVVVSAGRQREAASRTRRR